MKVTGVGAAGVEICSEGCAPFPLRCGQERNRHLPGPELGSAGGPGASTASLPPGAQKGRGKDAGNAVYDGRRGESLLTRGQQVPQLSHELAIHPTPRHSRSG